VTVLIVKMRYVSASRRQITGPHCQLTWKKFLILVTSMQ